MLDNLYENIGGKIKNWAKWIFIIEAIGAVITGIALLATDDDFILVGLLTLFCGPLVAYVGSWILYAFGELVEKTSDTNNVIRKIESHTRNLKITYQDEQATEESTKREAELKEQQEAAARAKREVEEKPKPSSVNDKLIANDLPIYTPGSSTTCDSATHKKYKDNLGNNIGVQTKDGHWEIDSILNEKVFVCNHCHGIIAFESDFYKDK